MRAKGPVDRMHGERTSLPVALRAAAGATLGLEPMCRFGDVRGAASEHKIARTL
jgi:hypothetical protein